MQAPRRLRLCALIVIAAGTVFAPQSHAEHLTITSVPAGATIEIDGAAIGVTPYTIDYPSSYFHKPHTVFSSRLEHALILKVHKEGYTPQQITLTDGPLQWISVTGRRHGNYFLLKVTISFFSSSSFLRRARKRLRHPPHAAEQELAANNLRH